MQDGRLVKNSDGLHALISLLVENEIPQVPKDFETIAELQQILEERRQH